jgi:hypothetical protein
MAECAENGTKECLIMVETLEYCILPQGDYFEEDSSN